MNQEHRFPAEEKQICHTFDFPTLRLSGARRSRVDPDLGFARVGVGIGFYGPVVPWGWGYPYGPYGYYGPYGPYGYYGRPVGEVHIKGPDPNAQIFINGAFAGRAHDLKHFYLVPGTNIEQRIGNDVQKEHVFVIANRSLKIEFGKPGTASPQVTPPPPVPQANPDAGMVPQPAPAPAPPPAPPTH